MLHHSDMTNADLSGASLIGADLRLARLAGAQLRNANLDGADLRQTDLSDLQTKVAITTTRTLLPDSVKSGAATGSD